MFCCSNIKRPTEQKLKMQKFSVFLVFAFVAGAQADSYSYYFNGSTELEISLGTPYQGPFKFQLDPVISVYSGHRLTVRDKQSGGFFDANSSASFNFTEILNDRGDFSGRDRIQLLNGVALNNTRIDVEKRGDRDFGVISLGPSYRGLRSVMDELLKALGGSRSVVLAIERAHYSETYGTIVLGNKSPSICQNSWTVFPTHQISFVHMAIRVKEVEIGKYHQSKKQSLVFTTDYIKFGRETYAAALKYLNVGEDYRIDCQTKAQIKISTTNGDFVLKPKDYIEERYQHCVFLVFESVVDNLIELPFAYMQKKCISFNFDPMTISLAPMAIE